MSENVRFSENTDSVKMIFQKGVWSSPSDELRKALLKGVKKWSKLMYPEKYKNVTAEYLSDCGLCDMFENCTDCPLYIKQGGLSCDFTFSTFRFYLGNYFSNNYEKSKHSANVIRKDLISILKENRGK